MNEDRLTLFDDAELMRPSSQESEESTSGSNEPGSRRSASARSSLTPAASLPSDGPVSQTLGTSSLFETENSRETVWYQNQFGSYRIGFGTLTTGKPIEHLVTTGDQPISGQAGSLVKISASEEDDEVWPEVGPDWPSLSSISSEFTGLESSFLRTLKGSSHLMPAAILGRSSVSWERSAMGGPSGFSTHPSSACPSVGGECTFSPSTLSDILTNAAPGRFYLSPLGAQGIIARSVARGRNLPRELVEALQEQSRLGQIKTPSEQSSLDSTASGRVETTSSSPKRVRRLTPTECELLMGWPPGWTISASWKRKNKSASS